MAARFDTHEVSNQSPPYADVDLFASDRPLMEALPFLQKTLFSAY